MWKKQLGHFTSKTLKICRGSLVGNQPPTEFVVPGLFGQKESPEFCRWREGKTVQRSIQLKMFLWWRRRKWLKMRRWCTAAGLFLLQTRSMSVIRCVCFRDVLSGRRSGGSEFSVFLSSRASLQSHNISGVQTLKVRAYMIICGF